MLRVLAAGAIGLVLLAGTGGPATGQNGTVSEDVLFEVVVPAGAVPQPLRRLYLEEMTFEPGAEGAIGTDNENMRGRAIYIETGELVVDPMADAFLWRQEARFGSVAEQAPAGQPVRLVPGDLILLPAIAPERLDHAAELYISNPSAETVSTYGFHLCEGGSFARLPEGMAIVPPATSLGGDPIGPLETEDAALRLTRTVLEPGRDVPGRTVGFDGDVLFGLYRLESGGVDATYAREHGTVRLSYRPGQHMVFDKTIDWSLRASGEAPATVLSLEGLPPGD